VQRLIFLNDFHTVEEDSLAAAGWFVQGKDNVFWNRRGESPAVSRFYFKRDNWPDLAAAAGDT